jgi:hypothetical protein
MKTAFRVQAVGSHDLPAEYVEQIGHVFVKFAYLEQYLKRVPWALLNLSLAQGALAVRSPRMADLLDMITDLEGLAKPRLPADVVANLRRTLPDLERRRDTLAHSGWARVDNDWCVLKTSGKWNGQAATGAPTGKRLATPEFIAMTVDDLKKLVAELDQAISEARKLGVALERDG